MKKGFILISVLFVLLSLNAAFAQNNEDYNPKRGTILVIIDGFNNDKGQATIGLYNTIDSYKSNTVHGWQSADY